MNKRKLGALTAVLAALAMLAAQRAQATLITLDNPNTQLSAYAGPYGTVDVAWTDAHTITVDLLAESGFSFGGVGTLGLNLTGSGFVISGITGHLVNGQDIALLQNNGNPVYTVEPAGELDGFGTFSFILKTHDGPTFAVTDLHFTITQSGEWDAASFLFANGTDNRAAGHVFPLSDVSGRVQTGFAGENPGSDTPQVPEPGTVLAGLLLLLPFGVSTIRILRRRS